MAKNFIRPKQFFEQLKLGLVYDESGKRDCSPGLHQYAVGWDRPVLESAVDFLISEWSGKGVLDLSDHLVVAPTRHAGRRLREALAIRAAQADAAVLPPLVVTPNYLSDPERAETSTAKPVPDPGLSHAIWTSILLEIDLNRFRSVFPVDPVERNLSWATHVASDLLEVRELLAQDGLSFTLAGKRLTQAGMEADRWKELARLERQAVARTMDLGYSDPAAASRRMARKSDLSPAIRQIIVLACPDLPGLASEALETLSKKHPVNIVIAAPEEALGQFDSWGRPLAASWLDNEIALPDPSNRIRSAANPGEQAEIVSDLLCDYEDPAPTVAIGVPDSETIAPVEQILASRHISSFDPSGKSLRRHSVFYLLDRTRQLVESDSFDAFRQLLRVPDWQEALLRSIAATLDHPVTGAELVDRVDRLAVESLPDSLSDARAVSKRRYWRYPEIEAAIDWAKRWVERFKSDDFETALVNYLVEVFDRRESRGDEDWQFPEVANHIMKGLEVLGETESVFARPLKASDQFALLLELVGHRRIYPERHARDIDLEGWLELLWEDAPHLILSGMNDGNVPESVVSHAYLPDSARSFLGLPDNDRRYARDAYLLTVLIQSREPSDGRVDFIFGRQSVSGDPLRPSRLLFQCSDAELPERTLQFFTEESHHRPPVSWELPWKLKPRPLPEDCKVFHRLSVTAFKSYLTCPFRFYLKYGLGMEDVETGKNEMNAREFGNLVHDTLEAFGKDPEASLHTEASKIRDFFHDQIDRILNQMYGKHWTTPVVIQREAARKRLGWWAEMEARERCNGWKILDPESQIGSDAKPYRMAGMVVRGRIDRIEFHEELGYRVFDFKTFSPNGKSVVDFHVTPIRRTENIEDFPEWSRVTNEANRLSRWTDLQLPLYRLALEERFPGARISVGYVTLGPTEKDVDIHIWDRIEEKYLKSAEECAIGVIQSIRSHRFWPPAERVPYPDALDELFFGDPMESVDPTELEQARELHEEPLKLA